MVLGEHEIKNTEIPAAPEKEGLPTPEDVEAKPEEIMTKAEAAVEEFKTGGLPLAEKMAEGEPVDKDIEAELTGLDEEAEGAKDILTAEVAPADKEKAEAEQSFERAKKIIDKINELTDKYGNDLDNIPDAEIKKSK
ncbi:MAG: hypothetical protein ACOZBH_04285 [Patescibacteria group bacterium]